MKKIFLVIVIFSLTMQLISAVVCSSCPAGNCLTNPSAAQTEPESVFQQPEQTKSFTEEQWNTDEDSNPENGLNPAKDKSENWQFANEQQAKTIPLDTAAKNKENGQHIYNKNSDQTFRNSYLKERTGKEFSGDVSQTETFTIQGKDFLKIDDTVYPLENIPEGTQKVQIVPSTSGKTALYFTDAQGGIIKIDEGICLRDLNQEERAAQQAAAAAYGSSGGSGGGGGGGSGAGGGIEEFFQAALGAMQQAVQFAQQVGGPLTDAMKSSKKGDKEISEPNEFGGATATLDKGAELALLKDGKETLAAKQNEEEEEAVIKTKSNAPEVLATNADIYIPKEIAAETNEETLLSLNGIKGDAPTHPPARDSSSFSITAAAIQERTTSFGQYIKLFEHDMDISGRNLNIYALKTFEEVQAGGQNIKIYSGDVEIKIEGQKIMYPRLVKKAPYGIAILSNKLDQDNEFKLQHYENKKSLMIDYEERVSMGDITEQHPTKKLMIAEMRKDMWV